LRKYYTEFNFKDRRLSFAVRVKKKGDLVFWVLLSGGVVFVLGVGGCFLAHWKYGAIFMIKASRPMSTTQLSPESDPTARGIVYSGQFGSTTHYRNDVEQPASRASSRSAAPVVGGFRLSDGQKESSRGNGLMSGVLRRLSVPSSSPNVQTLREHREKLLSGFERKEARDI